MLALHCTSGTHSPCFDEQSMRPDISYTIELSFFGFGAPQAAEIAIKATKVRMAWW
jgi:hypothetical protein